MQDDKQLRWEQREVELERAVANMERHTAEIAGAASQVLHVTRHEAFGSVLMTAQASYFNDSLHCILLFILP